ncbi:MAG: HNH endonuclease [Gammaproteobacteria bacterium]|nr:HNH endonuclease [Gammaproteobacteria bacterium]
MQTATVTSLSNTHSRLPEAEQLGEQITELCSYIYAAESRLLTLIREFDNKEYWARLGFCSCAHWLNFKCGIGMNAAREKVRVANALAKLPKMDEKFSKGELSYSKVRAMTRIADETNEDYLLMIAKHGTAHHVEKLVSKYRTAKRVQDASTANEQYRDRELSHYYDLDGCLVIKARFSAEQGALIVKALEMAMDKDFSTVETSEPGPIAARRADALADIAETYMNNSDSSGSTADRYQVVVHVVAASREHGVEELVGAASAATDVTAETSQIDDGPHVTAETSRRIACDCSVVGIKEDKNGEPLAIGRRSRSIPPPMRRALGIRDGGCRFPGCTNNRFVDGHHIKHWADGGETSLDNLVLLCRHHHHLVHEGGFDCKKSADGEIYFTDQRQRPLPNTVELPKVASTENIEQWMDREFFEATADGQGCSAKWYAGERMDWDMAVSALFPYKEQ